MKVYRVTAEVEVEFFVVAEDEDEARYVAGDYAEEAIDDVHSCPYVGRASRVTDPASIPKDWRYSRPYGDNEDDLTIEQILTAEPPEPEPVRDTWTVPMFPESKP
jgi:hypothetical protein